MSTPIEIVEENGLIVTRVEVNGVMHQHVTTPAEIQLYNDLLALREVRSAVLAYLKISDTDYALVCGDDDFRPEFVRLLRALHATKKNP